MRAPETLVWTLVGALALGCTTAEDAEEAPATAEEEAPAEVAEPEMEELLTDWNVRLDREGQDPAGFRMQAEDGAFTVETGPAGIAWRPTDLVEEGDFTVSAIFTELAAPAGHREAFGIVVGGKHLESPDQEYTYFLVRGDGSYLIKRRTGDTTSNLVSWSNSDAVQGIEAEGQERPNAISVSVRGDEVEFAANGTVLETLPTDEVEPWGLTGIRVNHNLRIRVTDWSLEGAEGGGED